MARVNVYIRQDDEELWELIENKSDWISTHLNNADVPTSPVHLNVGNTICIKHGLPTDSRGKCMQC